MLDRDIQNVHGVLTRTAESIDNSQTYNQEQNLNVNVAEMNVRDESDIHILAYELAGLNRRTQRGYGKR